MMIHDDKLDCESLINFSMYIDFDWKILYISFDICMQMLESIIAISEEYI